MAKGGSWGYFRQPSMRTLFHRIVIASLLLFTSSEAAAFSLRVHGNVTDLFSGQGMSGVLVRVYRDGVKQHVFHTGMGGRYHVKLDNHAQYVIRFSMDGFVTKCFTVDTRGAVWEDDSRVNDVEVGMTLFEQVPGMDLTCFDMPMGMARFTPMTGLLSWNGTYEEAIMPEVQRLMAEVRMRRTLMAGRETTLPVNVARP